MPVYQLKIEHRLAFVLRVRVKARSRRHAEDLFGRRMDRGEFDAPLNAEAGGKFRVEWDGEGESCIDRVPRRRRGKRGEHGR